MGRSGRANLLIVRICYVNGARSVGTIFPSNRHPVQSRETREELRVFQAIHKSLLFLILGIGVAGAQVPPPEPTPEPEKAAPEPLPLPPLPYPEGTDLRYRWEHEGANFATTTVRIDTVKDENGEPRIRVRGRLDYDRSGRIISGTSEGTYRGDVGHPVEYRRSLEVRAPGVGGADATIILRFDGPKVEVTRRDSMPTLGRRELTVPQPTWLLDDQCFEHWVLLAPYLTRIVEEDRLEVFVPHGETMTTYMIRKERTEGEGEARRDRWSLRAPALEAKLWTDAKGRLVEYLQAEVRIVLEPAAAETAPPPPATGG